MSKWSEFADTIRERDKNAIDDIHYAGGMTIENRIALADGRATTALAVLLQVLAYLDEYDKEPAP